MKAFKQPIEVRLKNGKRFRTEIRVPGDIVSKASSIKTAIELIPRVGGLWYSGIFVNWSAVFCIRAVDSLTVPDSEKDHGSGK